MTKDCAKPSKSMYRPDDGVESRVQNQQTYLYKLEERLVIEVGVVDNYIPVKITKPTMKSINMKINLVMNKAQMNGGVMKQSCNSLGHCMLSLCYAKKKAFIKFPIRASSDIV